MTSDPKEAKGQKKPYVKPHIREVELRPEEAVLGACKRSTVAGPLQATCNGPPSACSTQGS
ncbi:MAG TPA: hypothetical protein VKF36_16970 [Syntrophorhabdales bacterium]|nr:hypothetical protein [Syntrophorhabdales bacterium]